MSDFLCIMLV